MVKLVDLLGGHPLCMRVVLPMLEKQQATDVIQAVQSGIDAFQKEGDEVNARFYATLDHSRTALPEDLHALLVPLGMHERFIDLYYLEPMAQQVSTEWTRDALETICGQTWSVWGCYLIVARPFMNFTRPSPDTCERRSCRPCPDNERDELG